MVNISLSGAVAIAILFYALGYLIGKRIEVQLIKRCDGCGRTILGGKK